MIIHCELHDIDYDPKIELKGCPKCREGKEMDEFVNSIKLDQIPGEHSIQTDEEVEIQNECDHEEWNVTADIAEITEPPIAAHNYLVKIHLSCKACGMSLHSIDDGKVLPYLETIMFR